MTPHGVLLGISVALKKKNTNLICIRFILIETIFWLGFVSLIYLQCVLQ